MSNPMIGRFSFLADEDLRYKPIDSLYCHSSYLGKKIKNIENFENFDWNRVDLTEVVGETKYPEPKSIK
jgi:hypothetical protein